MRLDKYQAFELGSALADTRGAIERARSAAVGFVARNSYTDVDDENDTGPTKEAFDSLHDAIDALLVAEESLSKLFTG